MKNLSFMEVLKGLEKIGVKVEVTSSFTLLGWGMNFEIKGSYDYGVGEDYIKVSFSASAKVPLGMKAELKKEFEKLDAFAAFGHLNSEGVTALVKVVMNLIASFNPNLTLTECSIAMAPERYTEKVNGTISANRNGFEFNASFEADANISINNWVEVISKSSDVLNG